MTDLVALSRATWAARVSPRSVTPLEQVDTAELTEVYLPLASLLTSLLARRPRPLIVGIAGSVAVGKTTSAVALRQLMTESVSVDIVSTDGFLLSNAILEERDLVPRKGFPESYDWARLAAVLSSVRAGEGNVSVPLYDHRTYDVIADREQIVDRPDVLLLEGVNALAAPVAGLLDVGVYLDAEEGDIREWFVARFLELAHRARGDPGSFFARWSGVADDQVQAIAEMVWDQVNGVNLAVHIIPTRERADIVLVKGSDHRVREVLVDAALLSATRGG